MSERRALGWKLRLLIALGVLGIVGLACALVVIWRARKGEREKIERTRAQLESVARVMFDTTREGHSGPQPYLTDEEFLKCNVMLSRRPEPGTGWESLKGYLLDRAAAVGRPHTGSLPPAAVISRDKGYFAAVLAILKLPGLDAWGRPLHFACPGPIHRHGWDLWSCGPDGKDDQGTFDDILVGEDVAPETSR